MTSDHASNLSDPAENEKQYCMVSFAAHQALPFKQPDRIHFDVWCDQVHLNARCIMAQVSVIWATWAAISHNTQAQARLAQAAILSVCDVSPT